MQRLGAEADELPKRVPVEVKFGDGTILIRDTKHRRPIIAVTPVG